MDGHKLYDEINTLFEKDPEIDELGLVVSANPKDHPDAQRSPVLSHHEPNGKSPFILFNHKLGVAYWCIPPLYSYSLDLFRQCRKSYNSGVKTPHIISDLKKSMRNILLISADCYTVLNLRKQMILDNHLTRDEDITLLNLVFTKHPKSGEAWAHRRWVLASAGSFINSESALSSEALAFVRKHARGEIRLCTRMSEIYPKNYYSWTHRAWVLDHATNDILSEELEAMNQWSKRNVSDYCGLHHTQVVLLKLAERGAQQPIDIVSLWREELQKVEHLIQTYPGHEALWCHRRAVVYLFCSVIAPKQNTNADLPLLLASEIEFADSRIDDDGESHHIEQRLFAVRYKAFLLELVAPLTEKLSPEEHKTRLDALHSAFSDARTYDTLHGELWAHKMVQIEKLAT